MTEHAKSPSILKRVARPLGVMLWVIFLLFHRSISWALAMLFVGLSCGACVTELSVWPATLCFAAMVGQHLLPVELIERHLGLQQRERI